MSNMAYHIKPQHLAGFDLIGIRLPDGRISLGADKDSSEIRDDFPEEVSLLGNTYTLENIKVNREDFNLTDPEHPGYNIEWGQYA